MRHLLLDVMSTLIYDPFFVEVPAFFQCSLQELIRDKDAHAWLDFEKNQCTEDEFFSRFFGDGRHIDGHGMKDCMRRNYRFLDGVEPLLQELKDRQIPMYTLSNYPHWYTMIEEQCQLSRYVEWRFVSCHLGVRKPDPRAYLLAVEDLQAKPEDCVFVDDRKSNCEAAAKQGIVAIHFQNAQQLRRELFALKW